MNNDMFTAVSYAISGHKGQVRKYTNEPYVLHPIAVAKYIEAKGFSQNAVFAALFHDLVEDTNVTLEDIMHTWGTEVSTMVEMLTDVSRPQDGNRRIRKAIDRDHLHLANMEAQSIKCADLRDNASDIVRNDPNFAMIYLPEMRQTLGVLTKARQDVWAEAYQVWQQTSKQLGLDTDD